MAEKEENLEIRMNEPAIVYIYGKIFLPIKKKIWSDTLDLLFRPFSAGTIGYTSKGKCPISAEPRPAFLYVPKR